MNFFGVKKFSFINFDLKMEVKINLRIKTKNQAADPEIGFLKKSISKPCGRATAMPTAWELTEKHFSQGTPMIILTYN